MNTRATSAKKLQPESELAREVREGLTAAPKHLACRFFYDDEGSALFDAICQLPEYYLWRAEREILTARAAELAALCAPETCVFELGSGSASKTKLILEALVARGPTRFAPVDISQAALDQSARELSAIGPGLTLEPLCAEYEEGLRWLARTRGPKLVLWLGSNIGNLTRPDAAAFVGRIRASMGRGDRLLLGVDLRKDRAVLEPAYDDAARVTERFNKNLLRRINAELGADFDPDAFAHRATYDEPGGKIDMYLVSRRAQRVRIPGARLEVSFAADEAIHTESSYKYSHEELRALAATAGLEIEQLWTDAARRFVDVVLVPS